jgi:hypothetical protein
MVSKIFHKERLVFQCEYCGFEYADLGTAEICEVFCGEHGSCSAKITRLALYTPSVRIIPVTA